MPVTIRYLEPPACREIVEYLIILIAAWDIVSLLRRHGHAGATAVKVWLDGEFSAPALTVSVPLGHGG